MQKGKLISRMLAVGLLAALFSAGGVYAQTGGAAGSSGSKPSEAAPNSQPSASQPSQPSSGASTAGSTGASAVMSKADQKMMNELAQANLAEVKAGEMALQKSQNPEVKAFAQKMVDDHGAALKDLQTLAQAKGVTLPTEMDSKHKRMSTSMEKLSAERFDKTYISQGGVVDHKKTSKLVRDIQSKAKDSDLKAMAAKLQPTIDEHMKTAQGMKGKTETRSGASGSAGTGGTGSSAGGSDAAGTSGAAGESSGKK
jgi:putative membrane protein